MTRAYSECYLDDAMNNLGEAVDYAVNSCALTADEFMEMFLTSGYAGQFASGVAKVISGLSGSELVLCVLEASGKALAKIPAPRLEYDCSPEYWSGYILAYFQWSTGMPFRDILKALPISEIVRMYPALHEASERKAADVFADRIRRSVTATRLQTVRRASGMSQRTLSERSGVSLRSIQQYEQGTKDINKAAAVSLLSLARTLGCRVEDIMEITSFGDLSVSDGGPGGDDDSSETHWV